MYNPPFKYYQFFIWENIVIGRPVNPFNKISTGPTGQSINLDFIVFEHFAVKNIAGVSDESVKPGLYNREDIGMVKIGEHNFYSLTEMKSTI